MVYRQYDARALARASRKPLKKFDSTRTAELQYPDGQARPIMRRPALPHAPKGRWSIARGGSPANSPSPSKAPRRAREASWSSGGQARRARREAADGALVDVEQPRHGALRLTARTRRASSSLSACSCWCLVRRASASVARQAVQNTRSTSLRPASYATFQRASFAAKPSVHRSPGGNQGALLCRSRNNARDVVFSWAD